MQQTDSLKPRVFLSYSQKQTSIMKVFADLLRAMDLDPVIFDFGVEVTPTEKQKELIADCSGIVGLLTPVEPTPTGKANYSRSVHSEISMAYANNKKTQLIAINGPELSGLPNQTSTVLSLSIDENNRIDQEALPRLFQTLRNFEVGLRQIIDSKLLLGEAPMRYSLIDFEQTIISDEVLEIRSRYSALTLQNIETKTHSGESPYTRQNGQTMALEKGAADLDFRLLSPPGANHSIKLLVNESSRVKFCVLFDPPLETGTKLQYGYRRRHKNFIFYTLEELEKAIRDDRLANVAMVRERKIGESFKISLPTDRLKIALRFPPKYPIKEAVALVMLRDHVNAAETERVKELLIKEEEDPFEQTVKLSLDIPNPRLNYSYYLLYRPPAQKEISTLPKKSSSPRTGSG
jgi:hypothetical protein